MVKRITAILLTIAIVLRISAAQETYQDTTRYNSNYYQPDNHQTIKNVENEEDYNQQYAAYMRSDRDVRQNNDVLNRFNNDNIFNFGVENNGQTQVTSYDSRPISLPAAGSSRNVNWDVNSEQYMNPVNVEQYVNSGYTGESNDQRSTTVNRNNYDAGTGRVASGTSITGSENISNFVSSTTPNSGFNFDFNLNKDSALQGSSGNRAGVSSSISTPLTTLKSNILSGSQGKFDNIFQTADGKLVKVVEIVDNLRGDIGSLIPRKSQVLERIQESIWQKNQNLANGASGKSNNFQATLGGKVSSGNFNIGISKNIDVTDIVNGKLNLVNNAVNGATGKVANVSGGLIHKAGTFANSKTNTIRESVNSVTGKVEGIKGGLFETAGAVASAKTNAIHGTVNSVNEKVGNIREGLLQKAGAVATAKTNAIHGAVNSVAGKVGSIKTGLLGTAGAIANAKTNAIRGTVNSITGKVDNINRVLLEKAGIITDAKTGAILGIVNKAADNNGNIKGGSLHSAGTVAGAKSGSVNSAIGNIGNIKGGFLQNGGTIAGAKSGSLSSAINNIGNIKGAVLQTAGSTAGAKSGALSSSVSANGSINIGGIETSGSIGITKRGAMIGAFSPLNTIGRKLVNTTTGSVVGTMSGIKSGALNLTDRVIHPGKYYGIGAIKRRVVNNILDDVQDELQSKIGNVVGTLSGIGEGVKNHITDLSIIDNGDKHILKIVNGLYDTQFYLNDLPVEQAYVIFSDENQPVNFFGETLDTQQRIIEECIPTGQVYIAYKPDCVNVEEDERSTQDFITARNDVKSRLNVIVDDIFKKYGDQIIRKAVSVTNGRL